MDFSKETILIVDDSKFQRTVIKNLFGEHFNIMEAASGGECMSIVQENTADIDLVLLDLTMPGIDGFDVLRRRQNMQDFIDIPVVVLTTSESTSIQAAAYELGANDFLIKPIDENTAMSRIQNLLKSKRRVKALIRQYIEFKVKSEIDDMTGLFNKATIIGLVSDALTCYPQQHHALLVVDIDNFKSVNDVYGHTVGDHTISVVSNMIVSQFNGSDIVGRIGGDEFVIFVENVSSRKEVYQKIETLIKIIAEKENLSIPDNVTISVGLAFSIGDEPDYEALFVKADEALYESKRAGKSCYSEYGSSGVACRDEFHDFLIISDSRNISSMLEFVCDSKIIIRQLDKDENLCDKISCFKKNTICAYVDISDETDGDKALLDSIRNSAGDAFPVIVICREGSMEQLRLAVSYSFTKDVLFAPLESAVLKRRAVAHLK